MGASEGKKIERVTSLGELLRLVAQDEEGLKEYVYSNLTIGDTWWIPDAVTGLSKQRHPWIIVRGYVPGQAGVIACLRTTTFAQSNQKRGIVVPAGVLPELDKDGLLILEFARTFDAVAFRDFQYIGRLPSEWIEKVRVYRRRRARAR